MALQLQKRGGAAAKLAVAAATSTWVVSGVIPDDVAAPAYEEINTLVSQAPAHKPGTMVGGVFAWHTEALAEDVEITKRLIVAAQPIPVPQSFVPGGPPLDEPGVPIPEELQLRIVQPVVERERPQPSVLVGPQIPNEPIPVELHQKVLVAAEPIPTPPPVLRGPQTPELPTPVELHQKALVAAHPIGRPESVSLGSLTEEPTGAPMPEELMRHIVSIAPVPQRALQAVLTQPPIEGVGAQLEITRVATFPPRPPQKPHIWIGARPPENLPIPPELARTAIQPALTPAKIPAAVTIGPQIEEPPAGAPKPEEIGSIVTPKAERRGVEGAVATWFDEPFEAPPGDPDFEVTRTLIQSHKFRWVRAIRMVGVIYGLPQLEISRSIIQPPVPIPPTGKAVLSSGVIPDDVAPVIPEELQRVIQPPPPLHVPQSILVSTPQAPIDTFPEELLTRAIVEAKPQRGAYAVINSGVNPEDAIIAIPEELQRVIAQAEPLEPGYAELRSMPLFIYVPDEMRSIIVPPGIPTAGSAVYGSGVSPIPLGYDETVVLGAIQPFNTRVDATFTQPFTPSQEINIRLSSSDAGFAVGKLSDYKWVEVARWNGSAYEPIASVHPNNNDINLTSALHAALFADLAGDMAAGNLVLGFSVYRPRAAYVVPAALPDLTVRITAA